MEGKHTSMCIFVTW